MAAKNPALEDILRKSELFTGLDAAEAAVVGSIAKSTSVRAEDPIFLLGQKAETIYVIETGRVVLTLPLRIHDTVREVTIQERESGSVIGWSAMVTPHRMTLSARALEDCTLLGFGRAELDDLFQQQPHLQLVTVTNLARIIGGRMAQLQALMLRDLQRWVDERYS